MSFLDRISNQFAYDANSIAGLNLNYQDAVQEIENFNVTQRAQKLGALAQTAMFTGQQFQSGKEGLANLYRGFRFLKDNNSYINAAKQSNALGARDGVLPENRMSNFARKYYGDEEFRNSVDATLKDGIEEGGFEGRMAVATREGLTDPEFNLALQRGRDYVSYGRYYQARNPAASEIEIDQAVSRYAGTGENLTNQMLANARRGDNYIEGLGRQVKDYFSARFRGAGQYNPLEDSREIAQAGEAALTRATPYAPNVAQDLEMEDMSSIENALAIDLPPPPPIASLAPATTRNPASLSATESDVANVGVDSGATSTVGTGTSVSTTTAEEAASSGTAAETATATAETAAAGAGEAAGLGLGEIASSLLGPVGLLAGIGVGIYQLVELFQNQKTPPPVNPSRAVYDPMSV